MVQKAQWIRLVDVFILSPFMIWFGLVAEGVPQIANILMVFSGIATFIYNGRNYLINKGVLKK